MDHTQGGRESFAAALHHYRRLVFLRSLIHQVLFASDELDDELPSYNIHNQNWQHRMFHMRQTLLDLTHCCDRELQRAQQDLYAFVATEHRPQWSKNVPYNAYPAVREAASSVSQTIDIPQFEIQKVLTAFAVLSVVLACANCISGRKYFFLRGEDFFFKGPVDFFPGQNIFF